MRTLCICFAADVGSSIGSFPLFFNFDNEGFCNFLEADSVTISYAFKKTIIMCLFICWINLMSEIIHLKSMICFCLYFVLLVFVDAWILNSTKTWVDGYPMVDWVFDSFDWLTTTCLKLLNKSHKLPEKLQNLLFKIIWPHHFYR